MALKTFIEYIFIITLYIFINFLIIGCSGVPSTDDDVPEGDPGPIGGPGGYSEAYLIEPGTASGEIDWEYRGNYFIPNEMRDIMIYGNDGNESWSNVWGTFNSIQNIETIGKGINRYINGDVFTVPLKVTAGSFLYPEPDGIDFTVYAGNHPNASNEAKFTIFVVEKREYTIHYNSMNNHNIFDNNLGLDTENRIKASFSDANTNVVIHYENLNLTEEIINLGGKYEAVTNLKDWLNLYFPNGYSNLPDNSVWFFGVKDYTSTDPELFAYDISFRVKYTSGKCLGFCFIFTERG